MVLSRLSFVFATFLSSACGCVPVGSLNGASKIKKKHQLATLLTGVSVYYCTCFCCCCCGCFCCFFFFLPKHLTFNEKFHHLHSLPQDICSPESLKQALLICSFLLRTSFCPVPLTLFQDTLGFGLPSAEQ